MSGYIELTPSAVTLTDSITGELKSVKLHDGHLWLETTTGVYIQLLDNYIQAPEADKPAAGTSGRWFYATDSNKLYYDNGSTWQEILNKIIYCLQDTEANRPIAGLQGRWFYATDNKKLYFDNGTDWQEILNKSIYCLQNNETSRPTAGVQNRWFYATDTNKLYYDNGSTWQELINKNIYCLQNTNVNKPSAGLSSRWYYETDTDKLFYDNGSAWQNISNKNIYNLQDIEANKPVAGIRGRWFYATDSKLLYYDNGTSWASIGKSAISSIVSMYISANQSISANSTTKLNFNSINIDLLGEADTDNHRITIQNDGYYLLLLQLRSVSLESGYSQQACIYINGTNTFHDYTTTSSHVKVMHTVSEIYFLHTNDYIDAYLIQGNNDETVNGGLAYTNLQTVRIKN